jgi:hypothetical protein
MNFENYDDASLNYKFDHDARADLLDGLVDAAKTLKASDPKTYKTFVKVTAKTFNVTNKTAREWLMGHRDFIGKGNPKKLDGESGEKVYKMKVAFAKALILGQSDVSLTRSEKQKPINTSNQKEAGKALREYLKNDYTRTQGLRMSIGANNIITWEYAQYSEASGESNNSHDIDDWSATLDSWNPGLDFNSIWEAS